jgi:hypothetical protein
MKSFMNQSIFKKLAILLLAATVFFGCEDEIDVNLKEGKTLLVVDGWITDRPGPQTITLSTTAPYFSNTQTPRVSNALITLWDNEGQREILTEKEPGTYVSSANFKGKEGNTYYLNIQVNGDEYKAETKIRRPVIIDSLSQKFRKKSLSWDEGYYVLYNGPEQKGVGDFFRLKVYKNDSLQNKPENLIIVQDKYVDGNYIKEVEVNAKPYHVGDRIRVENWSITQEAYQYYVIMSQQIGDGGISDSPVANIPTNIITLHPDKSRKAVGFFGGASVTSKELTIK